MKIWSSSFFLREKIIAYVNCGATSLPSSSSTALIFLPLPWWATRRARHCPHLSICCPATSRAQKDDVLNILSFSFVGLFKLTLNRLKWSCIFINWKPNSLQTASDAHSEGLLQPSPTSEAGEEHQFMVENWAAWVR